MNQTNDRKAVPSGERAKLAKSEAFNLEAMIRLAEPQLSKAFVGQRDSGPKASGSS